MTINKNAWLIAIANKCNQEYKPEKTFKQHLEDKTKKEVVFINKDNSLTVKEVA